jgi:hypothetical protein
MAFPVGWLWRAELIIQNTNVDSDLAEYPLLLTIQNIPEQAVDSDGVGPALEGGGDIRFSLDEAGTIRLAMEIVRFERATDPANAVVEMWTAVPTVSTSSNTSIYMWWSKVGETQPAKDAAYGTEDTWLSGGDQNYVMVQHLTGDPSGSAPQASDSTANDNDGTTGGSMTSGDEVTGAFADGAEGDAWDFDETNDFVNMPNTASMNFGGDEVTVSAWVYSNASHNEDEGIVGMTETSESLYPWAFIQAGTGYLNFRLYTTGPTWHNSNGDTNLTDDTWAYGVGIYNGAQMGVFLNGALDQTPDSVTGDLYQNTSDILVGIRSPGSARVFDGTIDEVRVSEISLSGAWIKADYNFQDDPGANVLEQTPVELGAGAPTAGIAGPLVGPLGGPI